MASQLSSKAFSILLAIGIGGWSGRYLGPTALGKINYAYSVVSIVASIGTLSMRDSLSGLLRVKALLPALIGTAITVEITGVFLVGALVVLFTSFSGDSTTIALFSMAVIFSIFNSSEVLEAVLLNKHRGSLVARAGFLQSVAGSMASVFAILLHAPIIFFGAIPAFQSAVRAFFLIRCCKFPIRSDFQFPFSWKTAKVLIRRGWPLMLSGLSIIIYTKSDLVLLEWLRSSAEVGQYSAATRVIDSSFFIPLTLRETFLPHLTPQNNFFISPTEFPPEVKRFYKIAWLLGIFLSLISFFVLPPLLSIVYGSAFEESAIALRFLAPSVFAVAIHLASGAWLIVNNLGDILPKRSMLGAIINIGLNLILIPQYGIIGAAISTTISHFASAALFQLFDARTRSNQILLLYPFC